MDMTVANLDLANPSGESRTLRVPNPKKVAQEVVIRSQVTLSATDGRNFYRYNENKIVFFIHFMSLACSLDMILECAKFIPFTLSCPP